MSGGEVVVKTLFCTFTNSNSDSLNGVRNMSEKTNALKKFKNDVQYRLRSISGKNANVKLYQKMAIRLSKLVGKTPAWGWRYVQSVCSGSVEPSKKFMQALERYYISPEPKFPTWLVLIRKRVRKMVKNTNQAVIKDWRS